MAIIVLAGTCLIGCALERQWTKTGKAIERMANVYSGAGSNITQYVQIAGKDKAEWHIKLTEFWDAIQPYALSAIIALCILLGNQWRMKRKDNNEKATDSMRRTR